MINSGLIVIIAIIAIVAFIVPAYNKGISLRNYVREAFATMDVYLKKRWDLIPNLVETTKGYAAHEKGIFEEVTNLRSKNYANLSVNEKMEVNDRLSLGLAKLIAVAENYPDLKASENFQKLTDELSSIEQDIASSRKYYNGTVREFNNFLEYFPTNIIGALFRFEKAKFFEINEKERENVKVQF